MVKGCPGELRVIARAEALLVNRRPCAQGVGRALPTSARHVGGEQSEAGLRHAEDATNGLCWLELPHRQRFDQGRSLAPQMTRELLGNIVGAALIPPHDLLSYENTPYAASFGMRVTS